jgi:hypothetical protein
MKRLALVTVLALLAGCASKPIPQEHQKSQAEINIELAQSGQIRWSDYYKWMLNILYRSPADRYRDISIPLFAELLSASQAYESGQLPAQEFFAFQRVKKQQFMDEATFDPMKPLPRVSPK